MLQHTLAAAGAAAALLAGIALAAPAAHAQDGSVTTRIMIRATSHDAKIIGSGVGGARITVRNAETGELLARGIQEGDTGDTDRLVVEPRPRRGSVHDTPGAAGFLAELELERPTRVEILAEGPLGTPHATQRASRTMFLVPGRDVLGDGVVLELYGFTVELDAPAPGDRRSGAIPVRARVTMLCGCPVEPGGLWDADEIEVVARAVRDGRVLEEASLSYAGETSTFEGRLPAPEGEGVTLQVLAMQPGTANFGMVERPLETRPEEGG